MATYIIRPEINNATDRDYERLHLEMYSRRMYRVIKLSDDTWRDLPTGTYQGFFADLTTQQVYDKVAASMSAIGRNSTRVRDYEIVVIKNGGIVAELKLNTDRTKLPPGF